MNPHQHAPTIPTPQEFYDLCATHDWTHMMSDSSSVHRRGRDQQQRLERLAAVDPQLKPILEAWRAHVFSGPAYRTERAPKPERPE